MLSNLLHEVKDVNNTTKAKYFYSADGVKLAVRDGSGADGYNYLGSFIYKANGDLESVAIADGRITKSDNGTFTTNYFINDHLGSVRVIVDAEGNTLEQNDYYPFGSRHTRSDYLISSNRFKFNGKEEQTTGDLDYLDYGARMYDSEIGRWFGVDPLSEKYYNLSVYNYCLNNPMLFIDPNGMDVWSTSDPNQIASVLSSLGSGSNVNTDNWAYASDNDFLMARGVLGNNDDIAYLTRLVDDLRKNGVRALDWNIVNNNGDAVISQILKGILYQNLEGVENRGIVDLEQIFTNYPSNYYSFFGKKWSNIVITGIGKPFVVNYFCLTESKINKFSTNPEFRQTQRLKDGKLGVNNIYVFNNYTDDEVSHPIQIMSFTFYIFGANDEKNQSAFKQIIYK